MTGKLSGLKPEAVFRHFEALTQIPRESGNEKAVSDYLVEFAKKNKLEVIQEDCLNVIIKKPGTEGYETAPHVILQGHMDMVCVKREDLDFDFNTDPIPVVVEGDFVRTEGTTLGADNGIAVAMAMAILESKDMAHPPLTALITVAEETGMDGVLGLEPDHISGDILINIDSEEEGTLLASCAGGVNNIVKLPIERKESLAGAYYALKIKGLKGGHSGMEINQNRASAIKLLGRLLEKLCEHSDLEVIEVSGGDKMNAIAKYAEAVVGLKGQSAEGINLSEKDLKALVKNLDEAFKNEYESSDPGIELVVEALSKASLESNESKYAGMALSQTTVDQLVSILRLMPYGVQTMSANIEGLVESSNNIGVLRMREDHIEFSSAVRSSVKSLKEEINGRIQHICNLTGASMELVSDYPEWPYKVESPIREIMKKKWKTLYDSDIKVDAIHAGLECGLLKEKVGDIDMVSLGPNLYDVHTPMEHMSIGSVERIYAFLVEVLKDIK
ncbi:aminoacyl-histidine dipeptidase [Fusibacter sp. JL216-2]|uniref:aminoacyl-histidine dipeptidase n=1 Tax=Fusibacter sp. JL216-2 TaxID=3071453 RepID=UPI003D349DF1